MALRLVLVGAVAGLGLSLPSATELSKWRNAGQNWINTRLAAWDEQMPPDDTAFVLVAEPASASTDSRQASPISPDRPSSRDSIGLAARASTSDLETSNPPVVVTFAAVVSRETASALDTPSAPVELDAAPVEAFPTWNEAAEVRDAAFLAAQSETLSAFAADEPASAVAATVDATGIDPVELARNLDSGAESTLNRVVRVLALTRGSPRLAPPEDDESQNPEGANPLQLNNVALSGTCPTGTHFPAERNHVADADRLTQAVRLTRDAVHAWASLLHGPAVVTIGQ